MALTQGPGGEGLLGLVDFVYDPEEGDRLAGLAQGPGEGCGLAQGPEEEERLLAELAQGAEEGE